MTWFDTLMGFSEDSPAQVRANIDLEGTNLKSRANGRAYAFGTLATPSLSELRKSLNALGPRSGRLTVREVVGDVKALHADTANAGAMFQVASQFNLLEMVSPMITPEAGVGRYEGDLTQGPACAVAAGAGTIYRNYFAPVNGRIGQTSDNQIDCLADLGAALGNAGGRLWKMTNGYALPNREGLAEIHGRLSGLDENGLDSLRGILRIGIQSNAQVTMRDCRHTVSQAYCSALPVAYTNHPIALWAPFARLILEASYEAALCATLLNANANGTEKEKGIPKVYLTQLGGGAFGNEPDWILEAMIRALDRFRDYPIDAAIVSYGSSDDGVRALADRYS